MGFFCGKASRTKLITHLFPKFRVDPPTAIARLQTAIVTPNPRTDTLTCLRKFVATGEGIESQARVEPATAYSAVGSLKN